MLSIVIPTLNAAKELPDTFNSLMPALIDGMISEVIIVDGGSTDETLTIAESTGATVIHPQSDPELKKGRGPQLKSGGEAARKNWLLFLHADTELEPDWHEEVRDFIDKTEQEGTEAKAAAAFTFALKDKGFKKSVLEKLVALRCGLLSLPYGDQGLLISKQAYENSGGYAPLPIMEDVDIIRRLPAIIILQSRAITSPKRFKEEGYLKRISRNLYCITAFYCGMKPEKINLIYNRSHSLKP